MVTYFYTNVIGISAAPNLPYASIAPMMTNDESDLFKLNLFRMSMIAVSLYQNVNGTCSPYYAQYILGNAELMGIMQTVEKKFRGFWVLSCWHRSLNASANAI